MSDLPGPPPPAAPGRERVYLPLTPGGLAAAVAGGQVPGTAAHAVTPALREWYVDGDIEELELAALTDAAQAALLLLAREVGADRAAGPPRRVVVAADAAVVVGAPAAGAAVPGRGTERSAVTLAEPLRWADVVSVHLDEAEAQDDVSAAVSALGAAGTGDRAALDAVEDAEACDLLWYAPSEVPSLLAGLGLG